MFGQRGRGAVWMVGAVVLSALGACSPADTEEPSTSSEPVATSPEPSETVATTSPPGEVTQTSAAPDPVAYEDEGQERAGRAVIDFWAMVDRLSKDPDVPVEEMADVTRGQAVAQWVSNIQDSRDQDSVQTGDTTVTVTGVQTVKEGQRYEVTACLDWSEVKFNGVKPERGELGDQQQITYVIRPDVISEGELFVTDDPLEYESCNG